MLSFLSRAVQMYYPHAFAMIDGKISDDSASHLPIVGMWKVEKIVIEE